MTTTPAATITPYTAKTIPTGDPYPIIDNGDGTVSLWTSNGHRVPVNGREDTTLHEALIARDQLLTGSEQVRASNSDDLAPGAYLGRVVPTTATSWTAERVDWDDTTADHNPLSEHQAITTLSGPDAHDRAVAVIRELFEDWKTTRAARVTRRRTR